MKKRKKEYGKEYYKRPEVIKHRKEYNRLPKVKKRKNEWYHANKERLGYVKTEINKVI